MRVGFVGLGTMGGAMAANAARAGFEVTAWNRTPGRAAELGDLGVSMAATPSAVAAASEIVITMVSDTPDVEAVLFGPDGVADGAAGRQPRRRHVDDLARPRRATSPSGSRARASPCSTRRSPAAARARRRGRCRSSSAARRPDLERARPVLESLGTTITHVGPIGSGQAVKAVNQVILAGTYLGVAEGVVLALKSGLDVEQVVAALSGGAAQSWVLTNRSGRMLENDYPLGFKVALHRKDLGIALSMARELGASLPVSALCEAIEAGLIGQGHADDDMSPSPARSARSPGLES